MNLSAARHLPSRPLALAVYLALAAIPPAMAGDILRGGTTAAPQANAPTATSGAATATAAKALANAHDSLARTTAALQSVRAMQNAARKLALAGPNNLGQKLPPVPNGLTVGGLQVAPGVPVQLGAPATGDDPDLWTGATLPTQTVARGKSRVTIVQAQSQALLNWKTFNVGKQTDVYFNQAAGNQKGGGNDWIAFNKISDPSGNPSQILGSLHGEGTVYLINANGILFGGSSQINLFSLVASSLPINDNLLSRGLLNNPDEKFLFSATPLAAGQTVGAFAPTIRDVAVALAGGNSLSTLRPVESGTTPGVFYFPEGGGTIPLVAGTDYAATTQGDGTTTVTFTNAGLNKVGASEVFLSYTASDVRYGDVVVQAGATIATPTSASHTGGRVALFGANVTNAGRIATPDGQTILAAGLQVGVAAHAGSDSTLRGLDVFVGAVVDEASTVTPGYAGTAMNAGVIESARGSTLVTGKAVNQLGAIESSTTVSLNGRIDLLATYNAVSYGASTGAPYLYRSSGVLTLGDGSVTRILPELADANTVIGTRLALASIVNLQGQTIHLAGSAAIFAPNASLPGGTTVARDGSLAALSAGISLNAGVFNYSDPGTPVDNYSVGGPSPQDHFVHSGGEIFLDGGALIHAAGSTAVSAPVAENILSLQLRGSELADSPLQRDGTIRGQTLSIDIRQQGVFNGVAWVGTPLGDVSGFVGLIKRGVGELTTDGGTVNLSAGSAVVLQRGSTIDVSGGYTSYTGGVVKTSRLLLDGHVVGISQATPDRIYDGIYTGEFTTTQARYGLSQTYKNALMLDGASYEEGYLFGANGGAITVQAPAMVLDGELKGNTLAGPRQRSVLPTASALGLRFHSEDFSSFGPIAPNLPPAIVFGKPETLVPASAFAIDGEIAAALSEDRQKSVVLSPNLVSTAGFGNLNIDNSDGSITVPADVSLNSAPGGKVAFKAANLTIDGRVTAPSGTLDFSVFEVSPSSSLSIVPAVDPTRGRFFLGTTGVLSTAGLMVDDRAGSEKAFTLPQLLNGGSIAVRSFGAVFSSGSVLDVSGGLQLSSTGKPTYGTGGQLTLATGQDLNDLAVLGGKLLLQSTLRGFGGPNGGGSLSIQATRIQVGGTTSDLQTLLLQPGFFNMGGFGAISLIGLGEKGSGSQDYLPGLVIAPGTQLSPVVASTVAKAGETGSVSLVPTLLSIGERKPIALSFAARGVLDNLNSNQLAVRGDLVVSPGVSITTDPLGSVSLAGDTVFFDGQIRAPGGAITVTGGGNSLNLFLDGPVDQPLTTVLLGAESSLSTAGRVLLTPDLTGRGYRIGQVLGGGSISVSGNLLALAGAVLDVSGAADVLDLAPAYSQLDPAAGGVPGSNALNGSLSGNTLLPTAVASDAGSITLRGSQELLSAATLLGKSGVPLRSGGSLTVSSGRFYLPTEDQTPLDATLIISQHAPVFAALKSAIGQVLQGGDGSPLPGRGYFGADNYEAGGFDDVALDGTIRFVDSVRLTAGHQLAIGSAGSGYSGGIIQATDAVTLVAPYVKLGLAFVGPTQNPPALFTGLVGGRLVNLPVAATHGAGTLTVNAQLIDVGNLSLQSIGTLNLLAPGGDIRGDGTLGVAGAIHLQAGQIYPITEVAFTIAASDYTTVENGVSLAHAGSVSIYNGGNRPLPLSAGGIFSIYASEITQGGTLRAPIGTINLGWDGSGTAPINPLSGQNVAVAQQITLQAGSITSVSAIDPATGRGLIIPYGINLNGTSWIDPSGVDITAHGVPSKNIAIGGDRVTVQPGATLDLQGGGDLLAYRFVAGTDGSTDLLGAASATWNSGTTYGTHALVLYRGQTWSARQANVGQIPSAGFFWQSVPTSFAVVPTTQAGFAPVASFATGVDAFGTDAGYTSASLKMGDAIFLNGGGGLAAGDYTLLPARYALLPGAFLVTQKTGLPFGSQAELGGAALVSGYRYNGLSADAGGAQIYASFEISSTEVVRSRADYPLSLANQFLKAGALKNDASLPRLPEDAGHAIFNATTALTLNGTILAGARAGAHGGQVDISSASDIRIVGNGETGLAGELVLNVGELDRINAESLLIGGIRDATGNVAIHTGNIIVAMGGSVLAGSDLVLVANEGLTVQSGSTIEGTGKSILAAEPLTLGAGGLVLRVSDDAGATLLRSGTTDLAGSAIVIEGDTRFGGGSVTIDSPGAVTIDAETVFGARSVSLGAGLVAIDPENGTTAFAPGTLRLTGRALQSAQAGSALALTGYQEIDFASGGNLGGANLQELTLHSGEIRGLGTGATTLFARRITLDNLANTAAGAPSPEAGGTLTLSAQTIRLGTHAVQVDGFSTLQLNAAAALQFFSQGSLNTAGDIGIKTSGISGTSFASETITAGGALRVFHSSNPKTLAAPGLGASLSLVGQSLAIESDIILPSGSLLLHATTGDVVIGGALDVSGVSKAFYNLTENTAGGQIQLLADRGSVVLDSGGALDLSSGAVAGSLKIQAADRLILAGGTFSGKGGANSAGGQFSLDVGSLLPATAGPGDAARLSTLNDLLREGGFSQAISIRDRRDAVILLDAGQGAAVASSYSLSADAGDLDVSGTVNAAGRTGGKIFLSASGSLTLESSARLTVHGDEFSSAGKGGSISLEAGSEINGAIDPTAILNLLVGSQIDLAVTEAKSSNAQISQGQFSGTLHLRAPQTGDATGVQIGEVNSTILGASSLVIEGYKLFTANDGSIDNVKAEVAANGAVFTANVGLALLAANPQAASLAPLTTIVAGAEIINPSGDLTLARDWNLGAVRSGAAAAPGILRLRAAGNLIFTGSLSDGFVTAARTSQLLTQNSRLPLNAQSWTFDLTAGADLGTADYHATIATSNGSLLLGVNGGLNIVVTSDQSNATTTAATAGLFQVIRTGSGDIDISAAGDVKLLNQFATIYTAGTRVLDASLGSTFDLPIVIQTGGLDLGAVQENPGYVAQYSLGGGDVTVQAGHDILHQTRNLNGDPIDDSEREMPVNWLNRRGYVNPATGLFGTGRFGGIASTSWWVDFSNFFEGVGALGGGNVTLSAGNNVKNVDAVIPTNARMAGKGADGKPIAPNAANLVELGGGDLVVTSGHDINAGTYYVERGQGTLSAGDMITTNATRSPSLTVVSTPTVLDEKTWLPTTLFVGQSSFQISARGDILLGPVANAMLLPGGVNNSYWYKTYFSTYAADSAVQVSSLGGSVTLRDRISLNAGEDSSILQQWFRNELLLQPQLITAASYQPWLRLNETSVDPFSSEFELMPGTLSVTAFSGDINVVGHLTLSPSPTGNIDLLAAGSINSVNPSGQSQAWSASQINLSDADPTAIPSAISPFAYQTLVGTAQGLARVTGLANNQNFLSFIDALFAETGSTTGVAGSLQNQQALHNSSVLHAADPTPAHLYAVDGDISGLTLYSAKSARIVAGRDLTDVGLYLQNVRASDISVISAGRDIIAYDPTSPLRTLAQAAGNNNLLPSSGDLQISGPGTLEVLAGRDFNLGVGPNNSDGTGVGLVSIGNGRNPALPFAGADILASAGLGGAGLANSSGDFANLVQFLSSAAGQRYRTELAADHPEIDLLATLSPEEQAKLALDAYYLILRDAGRDHNDTTSPDYGTYRAAIAAIATLFPKSDSTSGDIVLTSREVKTRSGGNIQLLVPHGSLTVGFDLGGNQPLDQGILTEAGGNISIFSESDVIVGTSRVFTLRGGDIVIYSSTGSIAAGASSKTVQSAPPTRVLVDPQTGNVKTDLAGLATGGGIGVLATVAGIPPGNVDLIAPTGTVDAGDAGIQATGNLSIAAVAVLNADNIQVGGTTAGVPTVVAPTVNLAGLAAANTSGAAGTQAANEAARQNQNPSQPEDLPSIVTVEVLGYGG